MGMGEESGEGCRGDKGFGEGWAQVHSGQISLQ
jgi:hypothetical protein